MRDIRSVLKTLVLASTCSLSAAQAATDPLERSLRKHDIPGAAVAVVTPAAGVVVTGYGRRHYTRDRTPPGADTVFEVASLGKPVFAYGVMRLVEQGVLDLDTPVVEYLPQPWVEDPRGRSITARMLLTHTSGLARRAQLPPYLAHDPGERFLYSNNGYQYLQAVVEHLVEEDLDSFMQREVFEHLDMDHSGFVWREAFDDDHATGHDRRRPLDKWRPEHPVAAYSFHTSAADLGRFLFALLHPDVAPGAVSAAGVAALLEPQVGTGRTGRGWGLGWGVHDRSWGREIFHDGASPGFEAFIWGLPEDGIGLVVLTNREGRSGELTEALMRLLVMSAP